MFKVYKKWSENSNLLHNNYKKDYKFLIYMLNITINIQVKLI